ncbi:hypothetical protein Tco_1020034 [Tanacetum coccineum]|uniref:Uncharacterized protein n=1 Tax=Tanacetum coccineum TaxID=301880 RepID=A0ABQ5G0J2_9ASTR
MKAGFLDSRGGGVKKKKKKDDASAMESNESQLDATVYDATARFVKNPSSINVIVNDGLNKVNDKGFNSTSERSIPASLWTEATCYRSNFTSHRSNFTSNLTNPTDVTSTNPVDVTETVNEVVSTIANKDGGLIEGNTVTIGSASQSAEVIAAPNGIPVTPTTPVNVGTPMSPMSLTKSNLQKLDANVPNGVGYDVWLPLASVHKFSSTEGVDTVLRDCSWMIRWVRLDCHKNRYPNDARLIYEFHVPGIMSLPMLKEFRLEIPFELPSGVVLMKRFVGFKRLQDILRVTVAQLVLLVYKVTTIFNKVNAASSRVTTAERVTIVGWIKTKIA